MKYIMNDYTLVSSFDPQLINTFRNQTFVIETGDLEAVEDIYHQVTDHNGLLCVHVATDAVLSTLPFQEKLKGIPIYLTCKALGDFRDFIKIKPLLLQLNIKVFFPAAYEENFTTVKILSSLGIHTGILLDPRNDWDLAGDLMTYAIYNKASHAPVEPFNYALEHYDPMKLLTIDHIYFRDPEKFLYVDKHGNLAVSQEKLEKGEFVGQGSDSLDSIATNEAYKKALRAWQELFLREEGCAYCKAWRVCMGRYFDRPENEGCVNFFSELMDAADHNRKIKQNGR